MSIRFSHLRAANLARCEVSFHPLNDWSPADWATAMAGEVGEACNQVKKLRRLQDGLQLANIPPEAQGIIESIGKELADTVIYADLLAARLGIDLGKAVVDKFNEVSDRVDSIVYLPNGIRADSENWPDARGWDGIKDV
jgi:NTP pyrophosphatase (non-canonical NTP hydrolase)